MQYGSYIVFNNREYQGKLEACMYLHIGIYTCHLLKILEVKLQDILEFRSTFYQQPKLKKPIINHNLS